MFAPVLSICIPTHNRASYLEMALRSLTERDIFQRAGEVEIVISDNASTDETPEVIGKFQEKFPGRVVGRRVAELVPPSVNFALVLESARGRLRKLHNDTLLARADFLEKAARLAQEQSAARPLVFFLNGRAFKRSLETLTVCPNLDSFVRHVSFYSTWIGGFSLWAEDIPRYAPVFREAPHQFAQTEILFAALSSGRPALVYNPEFAEVLKAPKALTKDDLRKIYFGQYPPLLRQAARSKNLGYKTERREISRFCQVFYVPYYYRLSQNKFTPSFGTDFKFIARYAGRFQYWRTGLFYLIFSLAFFFLRRDYFKRRLRKLLNRLRNWF